MTYFGPHIEHNVKWFDFFMNKWKKNLFVTYFSYPRPKKFMAHKRPYIYEKWATFFFVVEKTSIILIATTKIKEKRSRKKIDGVFDSIAKTIENYGP